jgi:hypothetical protein
MSTTERGFVKQPKLDDDATSNMFDVRAREKRGAGQARLFDSLTVLKQFKLLQCSRYCTDRGNCKDKIISGGYHFACRSINVARSKSSLPHLMFADVQSVAGAKDRNGIPWMLPLGWDESRILVCRRVYQFAWGFTDRTRKACSKLIQVGNEPPVNERMKRGVKSDTV